MQAKTFESACEARRRAWAAPLSAGRYAAFGFACFSCAWPLVLARSASH